MIKKRILVFIAVALSASCAFAQPQRIERNVARSKATLALVQADRSWKDGEKVSTLGRSAAADDGHTEYIYHASGWSGLSSPDNVGHLIRIGASDAYLEAIFPDVVRAEQFGIFPDNTDYSTEIAALFNYCEATGKVAQFGRGTYRHDSTLTIDDDIHIRGAGKDLTILTMPGDTTKNIVIAAPNNSNIHIDDISITNGTKGIHHASGYLNKNSTWHNILVGGVSEEAILIEAGHIGCSHRNWDITNAVDGVRVSGVDLWNATSVTNLRVSSCSGYGLELEQTQTPGGGDWNNTALYSPIFETNSGTGLRVYSCGVTLYSPWFESNGLDVEIASNFNGSQATRWDVTMYNPNFSVALQQKRIDILGAYGYLKIFGGSGGTSGNNIIDGNSQTSGAGIVTIDAPLTVTEWADTRWAYINSLSGDIHSAGDVLAEDAITALGVVTGGAVVSGTTTETGYTITGRHRGTDPASPVLGNFNLYQSTGAALGADGDLVWTRTNGASSTASYFLNPIDEDSFASNLANQAPSQQSTKAYVDAHHGHAQISIEDNATATTVASTQSDWSAKSQFTLFGSNFASSSNATPDHTSDHITVTSAGTWEVTCVVTLSGSVVSDLWELALWKNNGATQVSTKQGVNIRGAGLTYEKQVTISGLVDASANDTIELWVQRTNGTGTLTITNAVMTATKVSD